MNSTLILLCAVGVASFVTLVVYLIFTAIQLRRTAQAVEHLALTAQRHLDQAEGVAKTITDVAGSLASAVGGPAARVVMGLVSVGLRMARNRADRKKEAL